MASEPAPSIYPQTAIRVYTKTMDGENLLTKVIVNPISSYGDNEMIDVVNSIKTVNLGIIPPGPAVIRWDPLERTGKPFRITAVNVVMSGTKATGVLGPAVDMRKGLY
eukprot:15331260-Ditylum_brightwellii.AAC.1